MRAILLALAGLLAAGSTASAANVDVLVGQDDEQAGVSYYRYYPATVVIAKGDTVTWKASSPTPHTVTSSPEGLFDSSPALNHTGPEFKAFFGPGGFLLPGQRFTQTFNQTGTFTYICLLHFGMEGSVTVVNATGGSGLPGPLGSNASAPRALVRVDAGDGGGDTSFDRFFPSNITVEVGAEVEWTNRHTSEPHTVTGLKTYGPPSPDNVSFNSSPNVGPPPDPWMGPQGWMASKDAPNTRFVRTFDQAGTFPYFCKLHPPMWGTVIVLDHAAMAAQKMGADPTPKPKANVPDAGLALALGVIGLAALLARRRVG